MDCKQNGERIDVRTAARAMHGHSRLFVHESVELADASPFWLAADHLLASPGASDPEQDSVWRVSWPGWPARAVALGLAPPLDGALGANDARRTRGVSSGLSGLLWSV